MSESVTRAGELVGLNGVRVLAEQCPTCIFRPGNLMQLAEGRLRDIVTTNLPRGGWLTCHATLPQLAGYNRAAVCRGWVDAYGLGPVVGDLVCWFGQEDIEPPPHDVEEGS